MPERTRIVSAVLPARFSTFLTTSFDCHTLLADSETVPRSEARARVSRLKLSWVHGAPLCRSALGVRRRAAAFGRGRPAPGPRPPGWRASQAASPALCSASRRCGVSSGCGCPSVRLFWTDEKVQSADRTQRSLPPCLGFVEAFTRTRNCTTTASAAPDMATGKVARCAKRQRCREHLTRLCLIDRKVLPDSSSA